MLIEMSYVLRIFSPQFLQFLLMIKIFFVREKKKRWIFLLRAVHTTSSQIRKFYGVEK